jgi:hypothetical protein
LVTSKTLSSYAHISFKGQVSPLTLKLNEISFLLSTLDDSLSIAIESSSGSLFLSQFNISLSQEENTSKNSQDGLFLQPTHVES